MKNNLILIFIGIAIGIGCTKALDQPVVANAAIEIDDMFKPGAVLGLAHFELEEGTDRDAFKEYLSTKYFPAWQKAYENMGTGAKAIPVMVEKGEKEGTFGILMYFPDLDARNKYFPRGGNSEEWAKLAAEVSEPTWPEGFEGYAGGVHFGDHLMFPWD